MPIVNSAGWANAFEKRKAVRDKARRAFYSKIGVKPIKDLSKVSISPMDQLNKLDSLWSKANAHQGDPNVDEAVALAKAAISLTGLAAGGPMATVGKTVLANAQMTPNALLRRHFNATVEGDDE